MDEFLMSKDVTTSLNTVKRINADLSPIEIKPEECLVWINEWLAKMNHGSPDSRLLQTLILRSPGRIGLRAISIMVLDDNDDARAFSSHGFPSEAIRLQNICETIEEKLPSVDAMLTGNVVVLQDRSELGNYSSYLSVFISYISWLKSLMAFPLIEDERIRGSVVWLFENDNAISELGMELFTGLSVIVQNMMKTFFKELDSGDVISAKARNTFPKSSVTSELQIKYQMSDRQVEIAKLIAGGATNREIAKKLFFSESSARYETIKIYERLCVKNRAQAAALCQSLL
jgi:DNA-binding CsgD family transcriptional regulator